MAKFSAHRVSRIVVGLGAVLVFTASCDSSSSRESGFHPGQPDCAAQLRFDGVTYTAFRFTSQRATKIGKAQPVCAGTKIHDSPVVVWSFPGHPPSKVIGSKGYQGRFVIYVADSVPLAERSRILRSMISSD